MKSRRTVYHGGCPVDLRIKLLICGLCELRRYKVLDRSLSCSRIKGDASLLAAVANLIATAAKESKAMAHSG